MDSHRRRHALLAFAFREDSALSGGAVSWDTDEHGAAQPQPKRISPQRTRRFRPWERTLPACPGCPTPYTQDACAPQEPRGGKSLAACKVGLVVRRIQFVLIRGIRGG